MQIESPLDESDKTTNSSCWRAALFSLYLARADAIKQHAKTGHPLIMWRDGKVYRQPPKAAWRDLQEALKRDPYISEYLKTYEGDLLKEF